MGGTRVDKGQPDREIYNLFAAMNQEQQKEKHDIVSLYQGRLRSHAQNFEGLKRKWEGLTGVPVPKKLRTSEPDEPVEKETDISAQPSPTEFTQKPTAKTLMRKMVTVEAAPASLPAHSDDEIDVDNMLVNDLKKQLKKRQLVATGRKAELQARLREHLAEAKKEREAKWVAKHAKKEMQSDFEHAKTGNESKKVVCYKSYIEKMDVVMEDADDVADVSSMNKLDKAEPTKLVGDLVSSELKDPPMEIEPVITKPKIVPVKAAVLDNQPSTMKKQAPKSALKPSKYNSSHVQGTPQIDDVKPALKPAPKKGFHMATQLPIPKEESDLSDGSANNSSIVTSKTTANSSKMQSSVQKTKISSTLAQTLPNGSGFKGKTGGTMSAKLMEKKKAHAAESEARKARMAEMRQKAKGPTTSSSSSAVKLPSSHSKYAESLKKMASNSSLSDMKSSSVMAKMREKAAAEKLTDNATEVAPSMKPSGTSQHTSTMTSSSPTVKRVSQVITAPSSFNSTALKSISNKPPPVREQEMKPFPAKPVLPPLSPMQTYEMSDREEESDSEESESDEEYERQRPKKAIPDWAKKENLHRALERQFTDCPNRLDPDKIFGEVLTCNLEEIFDKKKSRYHKRTSSGNWTRDHVTTFEKLTYKRTMGYAN